MNILLNRLTSSLVNLHFTTRLIITAAATMATTSSTHSTYVPGTHSVAFVTVPNDETARKLATAIVSQKLAACVNIVPKILSIYEWEGKITEDSELLLMIKTKTDKINELSKYVRQNHPYTVAEVISLPIENGNAPYLDWITKSVSGVGLVSSTSADRTDADGKSDL